MNWPEVTWDVYPFLGEVPGTDYKYLERPFTFFVDGQREVIRVSKHGAAFSFDGSSVPAVFQGIIPQWSRDEAPWYARPFLGRSHDGTVPGLIHDYLCRNNRFNGQIRDAIYAGALKTQGFGPIRQLCGYWGLRAGKLLQYLGILAILIAFMAVLGCSIIPRPGPIPPGPDPDGPVSTVLTWSSAVGAAAGVLCLAIAIASAWLANAYRTALSLAACGISLIFTSAVVAYIGSNLGWLTLVAALALTGYLLYRYRARLGRALPNWLVDLGSDDSQPTP